jgi:hypothetical protein
MPQIPGGNPIASIVQWTGFHCRGAPLSPLRPGASTSSILGRFGSKRTMLET